MSDEGNAVTNMHDPRRDSAAASAQDKRDAAAYRELMADVDSGRAESNAEALERLRPGLTSKLGESVGKYDPADLDESSRNVITAARDLVEGAFEHAKTDGGEITRFLRNRSTWPGEKRDKIDGMVLEAVERIDDNVTIARAALDETEAELYAATRPVMTEGKGLEAREDARMLLDGAAEAEQIQKRITDYVSSNDDDVAALITDPAWMSKYLTGRGIDAQMVDSQSAVVREKVADRARTSSDKRRRASAHALDHVRNIRASIDVVNVARNHIDPRSRR